MKAYLIDPETQSISQHDFDGQPNALYTLFDSLLVDTSNVIVEHSAYTSTEAFEKGQKGFFLGDKLLFGKALVTGSAGLQDTDATIEENALKALATFTLPLFYEKVLQMLPAGFAFDERYDLALGGIDEQVTPEWVFYVFNMADEATRDYFLKHLEETGKRGEDIHAFLKKMGELALKSAR